MRCSTKTYHDRFDLKEEESYWFNEGKTLFWPNTADST